MLVISSRMRHGTELTVMTCILGILVLTWHLTWHADIVTFPILLTTVSDNVEPDDVTGWLDWWCNCPHGRHWCLTQSRPLDYLCSAIGTNRIRLIQLADSTSFLCSLDWVDQAWRWWRHPVSGSSLPIVLTRSWSTPGPSNFGAHETWTAQTPRALMHQTKKVSGFGWYMGERVTSNLDDVLLYNFFDLITYMMTVLYCDFILVGLSNGNV